LALVENKNKTENSDIIYATLVTKNNKNRTAIITKNFILFPP
jgi:hypothetical protein